MTWTWRIPWTPIHMSKLLRNTDIWAIKKIIIKKNTTKRTLISQYNCHCSFPSCKLIPSPTPLLICHSIFNWCWQQAIQISVHCTAGSDWSSEMHLTLAWTTKINTKQHAMISKREGTRFKTKKKKKRNALNLVLLFKQDWILQIKQPKDPQTCIIALNGLTTKPAVKLTVK